MSSLTNMERLSCSSSWNMRVIQWRMKSWRKVVEPDIQLSVKGHCTSIQKRITWNRWWLTTPKLMLEVLLMKVNIWAPPNIRRLWSLQESKPWTLTLNLAWPRVHLHRDQANLVSALLPVVEPEVLASVEERAQLMQINIPDIHQRVEDENLWIFDDFHDYI